jgi:hypothetical protein
MAGTWKHGWIPTDAQAAREKAHGSKSGAAKALTAGKRKAPTRPKTAPKIKNPGGRNMQDLSVPKGIAAAKGRYVADLGTLPPGFGKRRSK